MEPKPYNIPQSDADKIVLNSEYIFPENNFRDNYRYTKGFFANQKKVLILNFSRTFLQSRIQRDLSEPRTNFNAYDKVLFGLNFKNSSLFERKFKYSITPHFSSGTENLPFRWCFVLFLPAESFYSLDLEYPDPFS